MLEELTKIVREAGEIVRGATEIGARTHEKNGPVDLVTEYDVAVQKFLREKLLALLPQAGFLGEEEPYTPDGSEWLFVVDPIDGTTNFVRGFDQSCISVALARHGKLEYAVIYQPFRDELYAAARGRGATLNGRPIHVTDNPPERGIFIVGTAAYYPELVPQCLSLTGQLMDKMMDFRRFGSAAMDLCHVAAGRAELFFEPKLSPWDFSAGALIVTEAGGAVSAFDGSLLPVDGKSSVFASNAACASLRTELSC